MKVIVCGAGEVGSSIARQLAGEGNDVTIDAGMHARTMPLPLQPFTLIGATTRIGLLTGPMRSRFVRR